MLLHEALDRTLKYCRITGADLTRSTGISSSRISQFRSGSFLKGKGSDLTTRALNDLLDAAEEIDPRAKQIFGFYLADQDPKLIKQISSGLLTNIESMNEIQMGQLLIAIADALKKKKVNSSKFSEIESNESSLVDVLSVS
jgi:transcriptional regulator with XRE-family HTH domain